MEVESRYFRFNYVLAGGLILLATAVFAWQPGSSEPTRSLDSPKVSSVDLKQAAVQPDQAKAMPISIASIIGGGPAGLRKKGTSQSSSGGPRTPSSARHSHSTQEIMTVDLRASALPRVESSGPPVQGLDVLTALPSPNLAGIQVAVSSGSSSGNGSGSTRGTGSGSGFASGVGLGDGNGGGNAIGDADQVDQPPREPAGNVEPAFPERERRQGIEGDVVVRLLIDETGRVENFQFVSGPAAFRQAVSRVAKTWRFEPARHRGQVVKVWGIKEVSFNLRRGSR